MQNKFQMTTEENIFVAKRNIIDYIWKSARLEGINVTYPQTYAIIEKAMVSDVSVDDILKITNLKRAWYLVINSIPSPLTIELICKINGEIARDEALMWGTLRTGTVYISGTNYIPPVPDSSTASDELSSLLMIESPTERAIEVMLWGMKSQLFWDGNKRTSMLAANKIMMENGCGIISVPNEKLQDFNDMLCDYYTNDTLDKAKQFVYDYCIDGIDFSKQKDIEPEFTFEKLTSGEFEQLKQQNLFPFESRLRKQDGETYAMIKFKSSDKPKLDALIESMKLPRNNRLKR